MKGRRRQRSQAFRLLAVDYIESLLGDHPGTYHEAIHEFAMVLDVGPATLDDWWRNRDAHRRWLAARTPTTPTGRDRRVTVTEQDRVGFERVVAEGRRLEPIRSFVAIATPRAWKDLGTAEARNKLVSAFDRLTEIEQRLMRPVLDDVLMAVELAEAARQMLETAEAKASSTLDATRAA